MDNTATKPELGLLLLAVPIAIQDTVQRLDTEDRLALARECGQVIASQGDTLQYGGKAKFGNGAKELARHRSGPRCKVKDCKCKGAGCLHKKCYCHVRGEPSYSAGEVFNFLASGLACAAFQPGGVNFAGMHFCTDHDVCTGKREYVPPTDPEHRRLLETLAVLDKFL